MRRLAIAAVLVLMSGCALPQQWSAMSAGASSAKVALATAAGRPAEVAMTSPGGDRAATIDYMGEYGLQAAGGALGLPVLIGLGALWGKAKPAKTIANLVESIQAARSAALTDGGPATLQRVDQSLQATHTPATAAVVKKVKVRLRRDKPGFATLRRDMPGFTTAEPEAETGEAEDA